MDFLSVPSLASLSYTEIALAVFYNHDVYKLAFEYSLPSALRPGYTKMERLTLKNILDVAVDKLSTLMLSSSCRTKVRSLIMYMIREFWIWKQNHDSILDTQLLRDIRPFWTKQLTIDRPKTARILIETKKFDAAVCFILACKYCFVEDALQLWSDMTAEQKVFVASLKRIPRYSPLETWIRDSESEAQKDVMTFSTYVELRQLPLDEHMIRAILPTKSPEVQKQILINVVANTSIYEYQPHFKLKCFQQLGKEMQEEILKIHSFIVLRCLLAWPFESNFLAVADNTRNNLSPRNFCLILETFILRLENYEWQNFELAQILKEFWDESPQNMKDYAKRDRIYELLKMVLSCDSLESLSSSSCILQEAYQKFVGIKILEAFGVYR
ncbi:uncharacterized protein LOC129985319 [Argiope bruennichi]|uniref:Uncharacterized protein n=1 Tax=Argiope bruennichi TaxID=94029 RepID=A0A8T0EI10_ARGBR|nr:uncharacterized protein LOC129985319 [Argiope bruennichi]KAF8773124.1 hypothetical protein HNY73_015808 [Argiope bruennichi]